MSDSGAEVRVVSSRLINMGNHVVVGRVTLRSAFGHTTNYIEKLHTVYNYICISRCSETAKIKLFIIISVKCMR